MRSSTSPVLDCSSITHNRKLSLKLCRQLLTYLLPAGLTFQQIFQWSKFPREPWPMNIKLFLVVYRRFQLSILPSQAICSSHPQQYHACWSALWTLPINPQLTYHPSSGKVLWIPLLPHIKGSSSSMPSWPVPPKQPVSSLQHYSHASYPVTSSSFPQDHSPATAHTTQNPHVYSPSHILAYRHFGETPQHDDFSERIW